MNSRWRRRALRIAAWSIVAILLAIAFHYGKKYESDMLTEDDPQTTVTLPGTPRPTPVIVDQVIQFSATH